MATKHFFQILGLKNNPLNVEITIKIDQTLENDFFVFTFNPYSTGLCWTLSNAFRWSLKLFLVITSMSSIYARTMLSPSNSSDIFS